MTISDTFIVKVVTEKVNIYSTENGRIPQNLMISNAAPWVYNGVVHFTVHPKPQDGKIKNS